MPLAHAGSEDEDPDRHGRHATQRCNAKLSRKVLLLGLVIAVAVVDALNPSTVLPALLYALGRHARRDVAAFTAGVFAVSTLGGLVLVFGPDARCCTSSRIPVTRRCG